MACSCGEGKRRNEFAVWHVARPAEWHNYGRCNICRMTERNKFNLKECFGKSIYYIPNNYATPQVIPHAMHSANSFRLLLLPLFLYNVGEREDLK